MLRDQITDEYSDERDDADLWASIEPVKEPVRTRWYLPSVLALLVVGTPWYLPHSIADRLVGGLPLWTMISLASAVGLAGVISLAALSAWNDREAGE
jgi:hypothetical protein